MKLKAILFLLFKWVMQQGQTEVFCRKSVLFIREQTQQRTMPRVHSLIFTNDQRRFVRPFPWCIEHEVCRRSPVPDINYCP